MVRVCAVFGRKRAAIAIAARPESTGRIRAGILVLVPALGHQHKEGARGALLVYITRGVRVIRISRIKNQRSAATGTEQDRAIAVYAARLGLVLISFNPVGAERHKKAKKQPSRRVYTPLLLT